MALAQNPRFPADKIAAMTAAHTEYVRLKSELFAAVVKTTSGKSNVKDDGIAAARKWYIFVEENPDWVTNKIKLATFLAKLDEAEFLTVVEKLEIQDAGHTKAMRDIISSDLRFFWTTAEGFYDDAAEDDSVIREKYKDFPSISPKRATEAQVEKAFQKLTDKRAKKVPAKNAGLVSPTVS